MNISHVICQAWSVGGRVMRTIWVYMAIRTRAECSVCVCFGSGIRISGFRMGLINECYIGVMRIISVHRLVGQLPVCYQQYHFPLLEEIGFPYRTILIIGHTP